MEKIKINKKSIMGFFIIFFAIVPYKINILNRLPLYQLLLLLSIVSLAFQKKIKTAVLSKKTIKILLCFIIIICYGFIMLPFLNLTGNEIENISFFLFWLLISICFSVYFNNEKMIDKAMLYFCCISLIIAFLGWVTAFTGYYFNQTYVSYLYRLNFLGLYRPNTIFFNINDNAVFMFFSLVILFVLTEGKNKLSMFRIIGTVLICGNILFVDSRGIELATLIFLIWYFILYKRNTYKKIIVVLFFLLLLIFFIDKIANLSVFQDGLGDTDRINIISISINNLIKTYFLGVGPGNISYYNSLASTGVSDCHNFFIEISCDYGLIGIISILTWYILNINMAYHLSKREEKAKLILVFLFIFPIISIVSSSLIGKSFFICFFALLLALLNQMDLQIIKK